MKQFFETSSFTKIGKRTTNEDAIYPNPDVNPEASEESHNLFLVCDGMGGHESGEIASDLICTQLPIFFNENRIKESTTKDLEDAVAFVESKFDAYITKYPEAAKMGSTLTLLHLHKHGATVSHIGDSRIYQIRKGKIIFETEDHSQVNALYKAGVITREEMRTHPANNVILKAIMGASIKPVKPETQFIYDLQADDIFFLCSDGVIEAFSDREMGELFKSTDDVNTLSASIVLKCNEKSTDNFSGYIIKLKSAYIESLDKEEMKALGAAVPATIIAEKETISETKEPFNSVEEPNTPYSKSSSVYSASANKKKTRRSSTTVFLIIAAIILIGLGITFVPKLILFTSNSAHPAIEDSISPQPEKVKPKAIKPHENEKSGVSASQPASTEAYDSLGEGNNIELQQLNFQPDSGNPSSNQLENNEEIMKSLYEKISNEETEGIIRDENIKEEPVKEDSKKQEREEIENK